ncbi:unnamed protein product [Nezara viridula]|uniref:Uncharacterized protein n=1 Tax=Nezara viridula TaxID=85310 RepID=A0A9P0HKI6_NEZVI|nr:unnamed protein product [Nezara viridula]
MSSKETSSHLQRHWSHVGIHHRPPDRAYIRSRTRPGREVSRGDLQRDEPRDHAQPKGLDGAESGCADVGHPDCQTLACEFEGASCSNTGIMPAPGTSCDLNKWCYDGACLEAGKRPLAVDGNWGSWSEWSECSRSCGAGVSVSSRKCDSPSPAHGGKSCSGSKNRHKICTTEPCDVRSEPFRDVQCSEYNDWVFPEDGEVHKWKGFFVSNGNPCALYCRNDKDVVVSLSPKVKDGTTCYRGMRDICVDGICRDIPCDLQFDSNSVEDACGICHGNGTVCKVVQGHKNFQRGISQILTIPAGTRNIVIEENKHTPSHLILKTNESDDIINEGNKLGMFNVSGSMGWLGMKRPNQEVIEIPGPLAKPVEVWITSEGPQAVTYSMGLPSEPREGKYSWDYLDWSDCMAQCGDSYQESVPKCVELLSGHVEDKFCSAVQKPQVKRRSCNAGICLPRWLVGEWQECGPCPSKEARRFRIVRCIKPTAGSEEGMMIISNKICPGSRPIGSEPCRCIKRQVLYWPSPYRFDMLSNDFKILPKFFKGNKTSKMPEKKVTLMQLENESEESMLKQFKENQQKHHSIFYMPRVLGSKFNFSIPFKKREAIIDEFPSQGLIPLFNNHFINYFPKPDVMDFLKTGNRIMGNNLAQTTQSVKVVSIGPRNNFNSMNVKRLRPISLNDPQPLLFSNQNILKLLSDNLPLDKLKQQHYMNQNNKKDFKNLIYFPEIFMNDTSFIQPKPEKKLNIIDILMNEFNNVLAANALMQSNTKNPLTTGSSDIQPIQSIASKPLVSAFGNRIQLSRQPFFISNTSGLDAAISHLQKNDSNSFINLNVNNLGVNNQKGSETWIPPSDHEWHKLLSAFQRYFFKKQCESQLKAVGNKINDQPPKMDDKIFLISTRPTTTNVTNDNLNPLGSLTRKLSEKLNTLSNNEKLKAFQLFTALVNRLYNALNILPQQELAVNDMYIDEEIPLMPMRGDNFEINNEKSNNFFNRINDDILRINRNENTGLNYSLPTFDKPIFSELDLLKIKHLFNSEDNSFLADNIYQNNIPQYYQLKRRNKQKMSQEKRSKGKNKRLKQIKQKSESNTKSILNDNLDEFIKNFILDIHKGDKGRSKKEAVQTLKPQHTGRIGRYIQQCTKTVTSKRRITGVYPIPPDRICPITTSTKRPKFYMTRCRKNIAERSSENMLGKDSFEKKTFMLPRNSKIIKVIGRKKRHLPGKPCEEHSRVCEELKRRFKDRLVNVTKLDPIACQRLREEIIHVKHNLKDEEHLEKDLSDVINSNMTCIFRYSDEKDTTTAFTFE